MALKQPESTDGLVYFTRREIGDNDKIMVWVYKQKCPKCGKSIMGKPRNSKGKVLMRAKEYQCPECKYTVEQKEYEETLKAEAIYTCPKCGYKGEVAVPFKRKKIKGTDALRFNCGKCNAEMLVAKKMKEAKEE